MRQGLRAGVMLFGTISLYLAVFSFSRSTADIPPPFALLIGHALVVLFTAGLVFDAAWDLAALRRTWAAGVMAVAFYLLNPTVIFQGLTSSSAGRPYSALICMTFFCAWLSMEHWSGFMRSLVLMIIFAFAVWNSTLAGWIVVALVPWMLFNRRPLMAIAVLAVIAMGGTALYLTVWAFSRLAAGQPHAVLEPMRHAIGWIRDVGWRPQALGMHNNARAFEEVADVLVFLSPTWIALAFWSTGRQLLRSMAEGRSDACTFGCALAWTLFVTSLTAVLANAHPIGGGMTAFVALTAPFVAKDLAQREFYLHRGVRMTAVLAFFLGVIIQWMATVWAGVPTAGGLWRLWGTALAALAALIVTRVYSGTKGLSAVARWQAILAGGTLASYVNVGYLLLKS